MKIAVIGAGIFGVTIAWKLAESGHSIDLFEREKDILQAASGINQYRLHKGYHYPRSIDTALSSKNGITSFMREYGQAIIKNVNHYYCISAHDSLTNRKEFLDFCKKCNLPSNEEWSPVVKKENITLSVKVQEDIFDPEKLRELCWEKIKETKVNIIFKSASAETVKVYDFVVYAIYANSNDLFIERHDLQKEFQFEVCEKPVLRLPEKYRNQSVVIMDGPFMCIDPLGNTGLHVMGHVEHAIHSRNIGKFPKVPINLKPFLNKGIIKNPKTTNIKKMIESAKEFFVDIEKAKHIGSMYTIRTVQPHREKDDARPTLISQLSDREVLVFSGKIPTCVDAAELICAITDKKGN